MKMSCNIPIIIIICSVLPTDFIHKHHRENPWRSHKYWGAVFSVVSPSWRQHQAQSSERLTVWFSGSFCLTSKSNVSVFAIIFVVASFLFIFCSNRFLFFTNFMFFAKMFYILTNFSVFLIKSFNVFFIFHSHFLVSVFSSNFLWDHSQCSPTART